MKRPCGASRHLAGAVNNRLFFSSDIAPIRFRIRIHKFLGLWSGSFYQQEEKLRKTLISTVLWLLNLLSLKTDVNVPLVSTVISKKTWGKSYFLLATWKSLKRSAGSGSVIQWYGSAYPDPYQNVTDPEHWAKIGGNRKGKNGCEKYSAVTFLETEVSPLFGILIFRRQSQKNLPLNNKSFHS